MRSSAGRALRLGILPLLVSLGVFAEEPPTADRQDRFTVGILAGSMFPQDQAYDTAAPEFGLAVAYSPEWRRTRLDLSAFATAGRSSERGVSAVVSWFLTEGAGKGELAFTMGDYKHRERPLSRRRSHRRSSASPPPRGIQARRRCRGKAASEPRAPKAAVEASMETKFWRGSPAAANVPATPESSTRALAIPGPMERASSALPAVFQRSANALRLAQDGQLGEVLWPACCLFRCDHVTQGGDRRCRVADLHPRATRSQRLEGQSARQRVEQDVDRQRPAEQRDRLREFRDLYRRGNLERCRQFADLLPVLGRVADEQIEVLGHHRGAVQDARDRSHHDRFQPDAMQRRDDVLQEGLVRRHNRRNRAFGGRSGARCRSDATGSAGSAADRPGRCPAPAARHAAGPRAPRLEGVLLPRADPCLKTSPPRLGKPLSRCYVVLTRGCTGPVPA